MPKRVSNSNVQPANGPISQAVFQKDLSKRTSKAAV